MPADDLVLNVRQIAGYPTANLAPSSATLLMQTAGLGSSYASISPADLVATALASGGDMTIGGFLSALSLQVGSAVFANASAGMLGAQQACFASLEAGIGTINGVPIATTADLAAGTVTSFNGRRGGIQLWLEDVLCAGGAPIFAPRFQGDPRAETPCSGSNSSRLATTAFVQTALVDFLTNLINNQTFVFSFNGRSGDITLTADDVTTALGGATDPYAPIDSPDFTGVPTAPTAALGSSDGQLATTAFVQNAVAASVTGVASFNTRTGHVVLAAADITGAGGAVLASPAFSGTPTAPTATAGTATTQLATTAFVMAAPFAPLNSPAFTGNPTALTQVAGDNSTRLATTAYVQAAIIAAASGVASFNGRSGAVSLIANDLSGAGGALLASPAFTGSPTAPTASPGVNTTQIATTQFVMAAVAAATSGVASFNGRVGAVTLSSTDITGAGGALASSIPAASTTTPLINGAASAGSSTAWSRGDHVHPTDTSRAAATALANYLPLAGGTVTGALNMSAAINLNVASGGGINLATSSGQPAYSITNPAYSSLGEFYYNITSGDVGIYQVASGGVAYVDVNSAFNISSANAYKPGGGSWTAPSDERIKTVHGDYEPGLDEVTRLKPVRFAYKGNDAAHQGQPSPMRGALGRTFVGLTAQAVEPIFPNAVTKRRGFIDGQPVGDLRDLDPSELVYALVNAIKTLAARVAALEAA